jgi:uncharacterized membrane protein
MPIAMFNKHDPWWEIDGPAARRQRRRRRFVSASAFAASLLAVLGSAYIWAFHLGLVGGLALHLGLG